ncbi:MAG: RDD family protein [Paraglaciecola chathamensis]|uniref:RDD family protein n=2 Tax=Paraglaciecola chathamensis TaxID=368405 RepID=A0A8H9I7N1_9ALTE|nr:MULTISPECIES: RDD family protein [Paraglaciecola]AEE24473.1 RDD domain containing protein [Glaciecola sp. 4H-3-7+YE-5]GAC07837.1 RDD domain containing protein [Paraglaciecola agarilytica NO2]GGZ48321.1 RDD family protein [Paraglaciecola oceanifecundans]
MTSEHYHRAGFFRRLAAIIYDILVAVAVGMCAAMVMLVAMLLLVENNVLNNHGYEHFSDLIQHAPVYQYILQGWVATWVIAFFLWFWRNGGQTIGMRAWRLRIVSTNENPLTYTRAFVRMLTSFLGLGTLLVLLDYKHKQSLQDRIAGTEVICLSKEANHHRSWRNLN